MSIAFFRPMFETLEVGKAISVRAANGDLIAGVVDFIDHSNGYATVCVVRGAHRSQDVKIVINKSNHSNVIYQNIK